MRLTVEAIEHSCSFVNVLKDRELDLRSNKIPTIENLGVTKDIHDTIDLTDNDIRKLENFPLMERLKHIYINNNRVSKIEKGLERNLPNLESLIMQNNSFEELADLQPLAGFKQLKYLSLIGNPVVKKPDYRLTVIKMLPQLKVLDFAQVKPLERESAKSFSASTPLDQRTGSKSPEAAKKKANVFVPGENQQPKKDPKEIEKIKAAIKNAKSLEEVTKLERMLRQGY